MYGMVWWGNIHCHMHTGGYHRLLSLTMRPVCMTHSLYAHKHGNIQKSTQLPGTYLKHGGHATQNSAPADSACQNRWAEAERLPPKQCMHATHTHAHELSLAIKAVTTVGIVVAFMYVVGMAHMMSNMAMPESSTKPLSGQLRQRSHRK